MAFSGHIRETFLPPEVPDNIVICPTMNRWGAESPGPLPDMIQSVQASLCEEGLGHNTWMLISDATNPSMNGQRPERLAEIEHIDHPGRMFFLNPEMQARTADIISRITNVRRQVVDAILSDTGYASQRIKLDAVLGGLINVDGSATKVLTLDDDTMILPEYGILKPEFLPGGAISKPNSQVIMPDEEIRGSVMNFRNNRLAPLFDSLGLTIGEIREKYPEMRATKMQKDTMHDTFENITTGGVPQFEVTHDDAEDLQDSFKAKILAATVTKHGVPDYRTVKIAQENFRNEFPDREVAQQSILSGPSAPFAFMESKTNVDSAALSRLFDTKTSLFPWWFVSNEQISKDNPLQTVTGHYRADNELLPSLMSTLSHNGSDSYMYLSGVDTQVYHNRARSGYRPDLHDQAAASLIGNLAAVEAAKRLKVDASSGETHLDQLDGDFDVPDESLKKVYHEMDVLASICIQKIDEIEGRSTNNVFQQEKNKTLIRRYKRMHDEIKGKLGGFDYESFSKHARTEIRQQLEFYREVLDAYPAVVAEVQKMIREGKYRVEEYVPGMVEAVTNSYVRPRRNSGIDLTDEMGYQKGAVNF